MNTTAPTFSRSIDRVEKPTPHQTARPPKLLAQVRDALRSRHYSKRTEDTYVIWIRRYIFFHNVRHPADMAEAEVNQFLTHLAVKEKVSASTQNQALSALLFLYRYVLMPAWAAWRGHTRQKVQSTSRCANPRRDQSGTQST